MNAVHAARLLVAAIAAGQGILPVFIDLNRTHATNSLWPGHARFHLVQPVHIRSSSAVPHSSRQPRRRKIVLSEQALPHA